jgi:hypothetical protein
MMGQEYAAPEDETSADEWDRVRLDPNRPVLTTSQRAVELGSERGLKAVYVFRV